MANALIGALKVSLGIDSAAFEYGLKKAQAGLGGFGKTAAVSFAAVAAASAAAASAMGLLVLRAANNADALSKTAQKIGVATEALSRLKYAADFSDVSLEQLSTGLGKLSKNMLDVATGSKGPAATAFAALGVSVADATGQLRDTDQVFTEIADKLSRLEDGALKTAIAQRVFGKSGAELIPLLNEGAAGLKRFADESDRTGNTISTHTGKAAERFNDTLALVGKALDGVANKIMVAALPAMQSFADTLTSPAFQKAAADWGAGIVGVLDWIAQRTIEVTDLFRGLGQMLDEASNKDMFGNTLPPSERAIAKGRFNADKSLTSDLSNGNFSTPDAGFFAGIFPGGASAPVTPDIKPFTIDMDALGTATEKTKHVFGDFLEKVEAGQAVFEATRTPFEQLGIDLGNLDMQLRDGVISWDTYGRAASQAVAGAAANALGSLGNLSAGLSQAFEDNKTLAIATAVLKGAESVASSFAAGSAIGGPFVGAAFAGVAAITAAANVAAVAATSQTSRSMSNSAPAASAPTPAAAQPATGPSVYVKVEGQRFDRSHFEGLIKGINEAVGDGVKLRIE